MRLLTPFSTSRFLTNDLWNEMDRFFDDVNRGMPEYDERRFTSSVDFEEEDNHYWMSLDIPGIRKEDLKLEVRENVLTVSGDRKRVAGKDQKEKVLSRFSRSFTLPSAVDVDKIEAHHENGVLELYLPKMQMAQPRRIEIQTNKGGLFNKLLGGKKDASEMKDVTDSSKG